MNDLGKNNTGKKAEKFLYIKEYKSSPIDLEITFISRSKIEISDPSDSNYLKDKLLKFGLTLANLEKASIRINALILTNIFGESDEITDHLLDHYVQLFKSNLFRLVG